MAHQQTPLEIGYLSSYHMEKVIRPRNILNADNVNLYHVVHKGQRGFNIFSKLSPQEFIDQENELGLGIESLYLAINVWGNKIKFKKIL